MTILIKRIHDPKLVKSGLCYSLCLVLVLLSQAALAAKPLTIDQRLQRIERLLANQNLMEILMSLQALQREVSELRGDVELLNFELDKLKKQQKDIYLDLDQRIRQNEQTASNFSLLAAPASGGELLSIGESSPDEASTLSEQESYQAALNILKAGRYENAIEAYQVFLISYPKSTYASNAQYWMAEAYYVLKEFESAVAHFKKVTTAYPDSRKVSDAYLKIGFSYYELKDWANARQALEIVLTDYASTTASRLAQRRLQKMKLEGHI